MQNALNIRCAAAALLLLATSSLQAADLTAAEAARSRALEAAAPELASRQFEQAEKELQRARRDAGRSHDEASSERSARAISLYATAELDAISAAVLAEARRELSNAGDRRAARYAPETLALAERYAADAEASLAADRYTRGPAESSAAAAAALARQAGEIALLVRSKPDLETLLLQQQARLSRLQQAADLALTPGQAADETVAELIDEIERLRLREAQLAGELTENRAFMAALEDEIRVLDQQLGGARAERSELMLELEQQARAREQFALVEALFNPGEAIVLRQDNTIIVRLTGLNFASGSAELPRSGAVLLAKLERTIALYPDALLVVEGHTDSQGSDRLNMQLSQSRADAVLNHIVSVMRVTPQRISAMGYGEERPIASNESEAGRARNRRIDLVITP